MEIKRRDFVKLSTLAGAGLAMPGWAGRAFAETLAPGLSDPALQPKFANLVPNALAPAFHFQPDAAGRFRVSIGQTRQQTGLVARNGKRLSTRVWGYGDERGFTWPGRTFQVKSVSAGGAAETVVRWENELGKKHLLPVDTSLHWAYSLPGYQDFSIQKDGVPIVTHLHGGHSDFQFDGNPEFFYSPGGRIVGPQWATVPGGFSNEFHYDNDVGAGNLWYHDHALGITRLNVYAGLAGFYFVRDEFDTGEEDNPLGLPA